MLQETDKYLTEIKNKRKILEIKKQKKKYIFDKIKKYTFFILMFIFLIFILFFPINSGTIIGNWLHDFFGTIYKNTIK